MNYQYPTDARFNGIVYRFSRNVQVFKELDKYSAMRLHQMIKDRIVVEVEENFETQTFSVTSVFPILEPMELHDGDYQTDHDQRLRLP